GLTHQGLVPDGAARPHHLDRAVHAPARGPGPELHGPAKDQVAGLGVLVLSAQGVPGCPVERPAVGIEVLELGIRQELRQFGSTPSGSPTISSSISSDTAGPPGHWVPSSPSRRSPPWR